MIFSQEQLEQAKLSDLLSHLNNSFTEKSRHYQALKDKINSEPDSDDKNNALAIIENLQRIALQVKELYDATQNIAKFALQWPSTRNQNMASILDSLITLQQTAITVSGVQSSLAGKLYQEHLEEHSAILASIAKRLPTPEKLGNYLDSANQAKLKTIETLATNAQETIPSLATQIQQFQPSSEERQIPIANANEVEIPLVEADDIAFDDSELAEEIRGRALNDIDRELALDTGIERLQKELLILQTSQSEYILKNKKLQGELGAIKHALEHPQTLEAIESSTLFSIFSPEFQDTIHENSQRMTLSHFPVVKTFVSLFTTPVSSPSLTEIFIAEKARLTQKVERNSQELESIHRQIEHTQSNLERIVSSKPQKTDQKEALIRLLISERRHLESTTSMINIPRNAKIDALGNHIKKIHQASHLDDSHFKEAKKILQRPDQFSSPYTSPEKKATLDKLEEIRSDKGHTSRL